MNVQEIAEFIVGNNLSYIDLVGLADQDGIATLMNPNVRKAQIILNEINKMSGDPIEIFNQYKMSLDEYQRPRSYSTRADIDFGDFSGIPEDRQRTLTRNMNLPEPIDLANRNPKSSFIKNMKVNDLEDLYDFYNLKGDDRNLETLQQAIDEKSKIASLDNRGLGPISKTIGKLTGYKTPELLPQPDHIGADIVKKTRHQRILDEARKVAEDSKKEETVAEVLNEIMPNSTDLMDVKEGQNQVQNVSEEQNKIVQKGDFTATISPDNEIIRVTDGDGDEVEVTESLKNLFIPSSTATFDVADTPIIEPKSLPIYEIQDGKYTYRLRNGEPFQILDNTGKEYSINEEARQIIKDQYNAELAQQDRLKEYEIGMGGGMGGAFGFKPKPTIETFSETIKKDDPSELKELGDKVKKGLTKEQKAMMGLIGLDVAGEVANYFGPARREGRQRLRELEERRERGQLGVDERQDAETMKYMTRPVRAIAEESEREQQAVMAGMGETRSAADLRRLRESRDAQMTDALSRAGQEVARQQMARKEMERRELNQLQAYQQENLRNLTNRISGAAAQMAGTFGANVAAEADIQKELDPEMMERKVQILVEGGMDEAEARRQVQGKAIERARKRIELSQYITGVDNPPFPM